MPRRPVKPPLGLDQEAPATPPAGPAERRIDITFGRLDAAIEAMPEEQRAELVKQPWWSALALLSRVRGMELAEEGVLGRSVGGVADLYDRLAQPGEHPVEALLRVFRASIHPAAAG